MPTRCHKPATYTKPKQVEEDDYRRPDTNCELAPLLDDEDPNEGNGEVISDFTTLGTSRYGSECVVAPFFLFFGRETAIPPFRPVIDENK